MKYLLLLIVFALSSCGLVMRAAFGVKKPKPRSATYIQESADKVGLNHFEHYSISDKGFLDYFQSPEKFHVSNSVNNVIIFNKRGKLILPKDTIDCSGDIVSYISQYQDSNYNLTYDTIELNDVFGDSILALHGNKTVFSQTIGKPLFVLTWASFAGKLNKNNTKVWADSIQKIISNHDAHAIFLSFDFRENWDLEKYRPEE